VFKRNNKPGNRFLVQKYHSIGTLHALLGQNMKNKKSQSRAAAVRLCAAAARYTVLGFLGIPYQVFWTQIRTWSTILSWNIEFISRFQVQAKYTVFRTIFSREIPQYRQKLPKEVCKRKNNPGNRFLVLKNHSVDTLHVLLGQNMKKKKITITRSAARLCAAAARYTVLGFLGIPYQVF
jgi:hypothetical protein